MGQPGPTRARGAHQLQGAPIGLLLAVILAQQLDSARFAHPPADVRPAMLWFWTGRITDSLIDHQLGVMRSAGLAEAIISPVGAQRLDTARVEHARREALRLGMRVSLASSHPELGGDSVVGALQLRHAASAAHLAGRPRIAASLLAAGQSRITPQEARIRIGAMAARGINRVVLHAYWSDSEPEPWWFAISDLVTWTARVSELATGRSRAPLALLVPTGAAQTPFHDIVTRLEDAQADFDLLPEAAEARVRNGQLEVGSQRYRVVIVPPLGTLGLETARRLAAFARSGGTVIAWKPLPAAVADALPPPGPRFRLLESSAQLIDTLIRTPFSTVREPGPPALRVLPLERGEDHVFLLFNESDRRISVAPPFRLIGQPELWNPDDGSMRLPATRWSPRFALTDVPLELEPFQVLGLVFRARPRPPKGPIGPPPTEEVVADATSGWRFRFAAGDTTWQATPLGSWTARDPSFSGTGIYEGTLDVEGGPRRAGDRYLLDLGAVRDVAEVELNGKALGRRLWRPYRYDVTDVVRPGANHVTVRVTNTLANRTGTPLPSGLMGPVIVIRVR